MKIEGPSQAANTSALASTSNTNTEKSAPNSVYSNTSSEHVVSEQTVKIKGEDGNKYVAKERVTEQTGLDGKTYTVTTQEYLDKKGNLIKSTLSATKRTERYGNKDVVITDSVKVVKTPEGTVTTETEESNYHVKTKVTTLDNNGCGQITESKKAKCKICKMPEGFNNAYFSQSVSLGKISDFLASE